MDLVTNPLGYALPRPERHYSTAIRIAGRLASRARFGGTVDSVLHDSADSYAQTRLIYLQNRRFELSGGESVSAEEEFTDPYEELYGE